MLIKKNNDLFKQTSDNETKLKGIIDDKEAEKNIILQDKKLLENQKFAVDKKLNIQKKRTLIAGLSTIILALVLLLK